MNSRVTSSDLVTAHNQRALLLGEWLLCPQSKHWLIFTPGSLLTRSFSQGTNIAKPNQHSLKVCQNVQLEAVNAVPCKY